MGEEQRRGLVREGNFYLDVKNNNNNNKNH